MPAARLAAAVCLTLAAVSSGEGAASPECKRFEQIYASGKELCEDMWGDAFKYEPNEEAAYTMWFFDAANPNDQVSRDLGKLAQGGHEACHLQYFHKDTPGPEPEAFTECHPWKANACCAHGTVETYTKLKEGYGPEYHWDRCGPLSQECERFFVQEACFYECDPNAGYYRKYNLSTYDARCDAYAAEYDAAFAQANDCDHNAWEMHGMPIKASYCDAWHTACKKDKFCAHDDGDFFSCAAEYKQVDAAGAAQAALNETQREVDALRAENERLSAEAGDDDGMGVGAIVGIIVPSVLAIVACVSTCVLVRMEKAGKPLFLRLMDDRQDGPGAEAIGAGRA